MNAWTNASNLSRSFGPLTGKVNSVSRCSKSARLILASLIEATLCFRAGSALMNFVSEFTTAFICATWNLFLTPVLSVDLNLSVSLACNYYYAFVTLSTDPVGAVSEVSGAAADSLVPSVLTLGFFRLGKSSAAGSSKRTSRLLMSNIAYICYFVSIELRAPERYPARLAALNSLKSSGNSSLLFLILSAAPFAGALPWS